MGSVGGLDSRSLSVRILPEKYFHASDSRNSAVKNLITDTVDHCCSTRQRDFRKDNEI